MSAVTHAATPSAETLSIGGICVLALGALDFGLEQSIIVPALPVLADHYGASVVAAAWLATGFLLAAVVAVPLIGRLGDVYGKRRLLLVALGAFAVGSLVSALTDSIELAIAGRIIQGIGAGVAPLTYGLARDTLPPRLLPRAVGAVVGMAGAGGAVGLLLSGLLADNVSPAAIFWFLFALAVVLVAGVVALVPESAVRAGVPIDVRGAAFLGLGLAALLLAISKGSAWDWSSPRIVALFAAAAVSLALFAYVEQHVRQPLVDLALVVSRPFASANVCVFAFGFAFYVAVFVVPQIAASPTTSPYGLGLSTMGVGYLLLPTGITSIVGGWAGGRVVDAVGPRALVAFGSVLGVAGYASLTLAHTTWAALAAGSAVVGLAWGFILTGVYPVVIRSASTDKTAVAVAVNVVVRNTAVSVGTQVAFAIVTGAGVVGAFPSESGYTRAFVVAGIGAGVLLVASAFMPGRAAATR
jgi:MFS family permease